MNHVPIVQLQQLNISQSFLLSSPRQVICFIVLHWNSFKANTRHILYPQILIRSLLVITISHLTKSTVHLISNSEASLLASNVL